MDIKELDKKQLILLTLLITFVVSIGTGIVTVSLMKQMPQSVPQTINNVIQRTIEKVSTVEIPSTNITGQNNTSTSQSQNSILFSGNDEALVSIYKKDTKGDIANTPISEGNGTVNNDTTSAIGQGVIISDIGLVLVDSNILNGDEFYRIVLDKTDFDASVLKKFNNGFTVLKISEISDKNPIPVTTDTETKTQ